MDAHRQARQIMDAFAEHASDSMVLNDDFIWLHEKLSMAFVEKEKRIAELERALENQKKFIAECLSCYCEYDKVHPGRCAVCEASTAIDVVLEKK